MGPGCWIFVDPVSTFGDRRHTRRGSFGLLVRDLVPRDDDCDDRLILTAAHLLDGIPDEARVLYAPTGPEPSIEAGQYCGTIRRRVPLHHVPSISVDAAVIKPPPDIDCSNELACGEPNGIRDLWLVEDDLETVTVRKHGARTQMTCGELMAVPADHYMKDVRARYSSGWWVYGDGDAFAARGDSGSIVVDEARRIVGMVVAVEHPGSGAAAFVHGIKQVFTALQIDLP